MHCSQCEKSDLTLMNETLEKYKNIKGSLITVLQKAQEIYGYLPTDVIYKIAEELDLTPAKVMGVATFYTQFRFKPVGKDGLFTLKNVACLGCCSLSPVMMINEETYGSLTPEKVKAILKSLKEGEE